jgi:hypothetical protein
MAQQGWIVRGGWGLLLAGVLLAGSARPALAQDTEQRHFTIQVDGKPAGDARMTITRREDGSEVLSSQANVQVRFLLRYTYTYQGTEVWKTGRLQGLQCSCNDNGKRFEVSATAEGAGLRVRVNGRERLGRADVWTTSFWKLADARYHNQPVTLLDADRGEELARRLDYVGTEDTPAAGQVQKCYHFRVTGGASPIDLWFDVQHRLVRQDFVDTGHRTVVQLTEVRR